MEAFNTESVIRYVGESKTRVIDSRDVAKMVGKRHRDLMRDIRRYISDMEEGAILRSRDMDQNPKLDSAQFFIESSYQAGTGKNYKCYLLTKQGCEFVANKLTGRKGTIFTATYVSLFNEYEAEHNGKLIANNGDLNLQRQDLEYHRRYVAVKEQEAANKRAELLIKIGDRQEEERYRQAYYTEATNQLMFPITNGLAVTAGAIAEQLGTNAYNIGKWGQILGLKAPKGHRSQYGYWSGDRYYYNEKAIEKFQEHKKEIVDDDNDLGL